MIEHVLMITVDDQTYEIAVGKVVDMDRRYWASRMGICGAHFVRRVLKGRVTDQRAAMLINSFQTSLLSWPQCTDGCKYFDVEHVEHCDDCRGRELYIALWLGKGILPLFDSLLAEFGDRLRVKPLRIGRVLLVDGY